MFRHQSSDSRLDQGTSVQLNPTVERKLLGYAAAAGAGAILTLVPPSEAKIVFTPTHRTIFPNTTLTIDINNDGIGDFSITDFSDHASSSLSRHAYGNIKGTGLRPSNGFAHYYNFVAALKAGVKIVPSFFVGHPSFMFVCHTSRSGASQTGPWSVVTNRFLGLKFSINGQTHYGWARLSTKEGPAPCEDTLVLTGYAYETVANRPIVTGKTTGPEVSEVRAATLGKLAVGAAGLVAWRREEDVLA